MDNKRKCSRGNGSKGNDMAEVIRQDNYSTLWRELVNILRDIWRGNLPLGEIPRFFFWLIREGHYGMA